MTYKIGTLCMVNTCSNPGLHRVRNSLVGFLVCDEHLKLARNIGLQLMLAVEELSNEAYDKMLNYNEEEG